MLKFGIKVGIAAGTFYYLSEEGIWRESEQSIKAYDKLTAAVEPYIKEVSSQIPIQFPALPSSERISYLTKHYWNQGVMSTFQFIQDLPDNATRLGCKGMQLLNNNSEIKKFIASFKAAPAAGNALEEPESPRKTPK